MERYTSEIKVIPYSVSTVYQKLSTFNFIKNINHPELDKMVKIEEISEDRLCIKPEKLGARICINIVEREENKTIKFMSEESPVPITFWIQLKENNPQSTYIKLTLDAKLNFFIKKLIGKKLQSSLNQVADMLTQIPYQFI